MGKIVKTLINKFDGGISNDLRSAQPNKYALAYNFDSLTYPHKLVPYRSTESEGTEHKEYNILTFLYAPYGNASSYMLYGLGQDGTPANPCVYFYDIDTTFPTTWSGGAYFKSAATSWNTKVIFYYKSYLYIWTSGKLQRCDVTAATNNFADYQTISWGTVARPVHHPSDDVAYFFYDNIVCSLNNATWNGAALTLPSNLKIVDACPYGNYLAIACVNKGSADNESIVYLWDRDSSLTTLTERIDFGKGRIAHLANLEDKLFAVIDLFLTGNGKANRGKILIKQYGGGKFAKKINELITDANITGTMGLPNVRYQKDDKLYFATSAPYNSDTRKGIWVLDGSGRLNLDFVEEEAVAGNYNGIYQVGNIWFIAHSDDGSVNRTNDNEINLYTSVYESLIFSNGDSSVTKKLLDFRLMNEKLVANDSLSVIVKYRVDGDIFGGSWTTLLTRTTANAGATLHEAINIESSGVTLPEYKEIQFRIEVESGAQSPTVTGFEFNSEVIPKNLSNV